jgi:hypothetical protein
MIFYGIDHDGHYRDCHGYGFLAADSDGRVLIDSSMRQKISQ